MSYHEKYNSTRDLTFFKRERNWYFRYGMSLLFTLFLVLLLLGMAIPYPDHLSSDAVLRTPNPAISVQARATIPLDTILVRAGDTIQSSTLLAVLDNTALYRDVAKIKESLMETQHEHFYDRVANQTNTTVLKLGSGVQRAYQRYVRAKMDLVLQVENRKDSLGFRDWTQRMKLSQSNYFQKKEALALAERELELARNTFERYQGLHEKGVISDQEWEGHKNRFINVQGKQRAAQNEHENTKRAYLQLATRRRLAEANLLARSQIRESELHLAQQELWAVIAEWEEKYLLRSPIHGRVVFMQDWQPKQSVTQGNPVFAIVPLGKQPWFAHCKIPMQNSGKLKLGQRVLVSLDNYPVLENGYVEGTVERIAEVPLDGHYSVRVNLEGTDTALQLGQEMRGTAKIIIEDTNLLQRLFQNLRYAFSNGSNDSESATKKQRP